MKITHQFINSRKSSPSQSMSRWFTSSSSSQGFRKRTCSRLLSLGRLLYSQNYSSECETRSGSMDARWRAARECSKPNQSIRSQSRKSSESLSWVCPASAIQARPQSEKEAQRSGQMLNSFFNLFQGCALQNSYILSSYSTYSALSRSSAHLVKLQAGDNLIIQSTIATQSCSSSTNLPEQIWQSWLMVRGLMCLVHSAQRCDHSSKMASKRGQILSAVGRKGLSELRHSLMLKVMSSRQRTSRWCSGQSFTKLTTLRTSSAFSAMIASRTPHSVSLTRYTRNMASISLSINRLAIDLRMRRIGYFRQTVQCRARHRKIGEIFFSYLLSYASQDIPAQMRFLLDVEGGSKESSWVALRASGTGC